MSGELATLNAVLTRIGVEPDTDDAADALTLLRAVSAEVKRRTGRDFEGTGTVYEEVIDTRGSRTIILPHVPVTDVLHVASEDWDGTRVAIDTPNVGDYATALAADLAVGDTNMKVDAVDDISVGDHLAIGSDEVVYVTSVGTAGAGGTGVGFVPAATFANATDVAVVHSTGSTWWRLIDAERGRLERAYGVVGPRSWDETDTEQFRGRRFVVPRWRVSGSVPADVSEAVVDWCAARWSERDRSPGQTAYTTGDDSETWDAGTAGTPPPSAASVFAGVWHPSKNGVI